MKYIAVSLVIPAFILLTEGCTDTVGQATRQASPPADFNHYWYDGLAELNSYRVQQERYGEMRDAQQVLVTVTEDLSAAKQVKLDNPEAAGADRLPVLKVNTVRRFHTGIYDYSITQSVFLPVDGSPMAKLTTAVQDWCGHVFTQLNRQDNGYRLREFSYFETEGDTDRPLPDAIPEDAFWAMIRLDPQKLPQGKHLLIPGTLPARFRHRLLQAENAVLSRTEETTTTTYTIDYPLLKRNLRIHFETAFPHRITGWEEREGDRLMSKGELIRSMRTDYWAKHNNADLPLRDTLMWHF